MHVSEYNGMINFFGGDAVNRYRIRCSGPVVTAFGLGLIAAQIVPYSILFIIAAASLIFIGVALCQC